MKTRALALLAGLALPVLALGCQVTVTNGEDCGEMPAVDLECGYGLECVDGEWVSVSQGDALCEACPESLPADGDACSTIGMECEYYGYQGECGEESTPVYAECTDSGWVSYWTRCQPEPVCPDTLPAAGTDCSGWDEAYWCNYEVACDELAMVSMHCDFASDPPLWVVDSGSPTCGLTCDVFADRESCATNAACQWLEPGCAGEDQIAITAGCFPVNDCLATGACGEQQICAELVYDPCFEQPCDACGATTYQCVDVEVGGGGGA